MSVYPDNFSNDAFNQYWGTPSHLSLKEIDALEAYQAEEEYIESRLQQIEKMYDIDDYEQWPYKEYYEYEEITERLRDVRKYIFSFNDDDSF